jgi:exosortase
MNMVGSREESAAKFELNYRKLAPTVAPLVAAVVLMVVLYINAILWWKFEWTQEGSYYAHGIFIPFFVGLMVWRDRERLKRLPISRNYWGWVLVTMAVALVMLAQYAQVPVSLSISFIIFLIGATLLLAGKAVTKALLFPMLFLFTMIPLVPDQLINPIAFPIQMTSAKMAASVCNLIGFPAVRGGTHIQMEHYLLNVELPCSGFKTLVGLMAFSAAFAYLVEAAKWKRWLLFAVSPPLAILVNGIRISFIALVGETFGAGAAAAFHDWSGFIVLILGFMFLFSLARAIKCDSFLGMPLIDPPPATAEDGSENKEAEPVAVDKEAAKAREEESLRLERAAEQEKLDAQYGPRRVNTIRHLTRGIYPLLGLLAVACVIKAGIHPPAFTGNAVGPKEVPISLAGGTWQRVGMDVPIDKVVKEVTNPKAWLDRNYSSPGRPTMINLLISAGNGRRVFHDPHTCFLGSGYFLHDVGTEKIDTPRGPVTVQLSEVEDPNHGRSLMMFLYVVGGKQLQTTQAVNWALIGQTLLGDGGKPSYFIRFRQLASGTGPDRHEELRSFVRAVWSDVGPQVSDAPPQRTALK